MGSAAATSPLDVYGIDPLSGAPQAKAITRRNGPVPGPVPGVFVKHGVDAVEDAIWSARRLLATSSLTR